MEQTNDGGSVFPDPGRAQSAKQREHLTETGISLRDYFAGKAISSLASDSSISFDVKASIAYHIADAMLAERAK